MKSRKLAYGVDLRELTKVGDSSHSGPEQWGQKRARWCGFPSLLQVEARCRVTRYGVGKLKDLQEYDEVLTLLHESDKLGGGGGGAVIIVVSVVDRYYCNTCSMGSRRKTPRA